MPRQQNDAVVYARMGAAAILGWLVPGLGHWILGCRARAVILFVTIGLTFWGGIALGGVKSTVDVQENQLWFIPQSFAGGHAIGALAWSEALPSIGPNEKNPPMEVVQRYRYWPDVDLGQVYTGVAGLLNLLCVLDVLARGQRVPVAGAARGRPTAREKPS